MNPPQTKRWRILRRCLVGLGVCLTLTGLFYTEELWRGKRAWENCKRALEAQGVDFNWADCIPAPVPDNENVFGVPEIQQWFTGHGGTELSKKMSYPGFGCWTNLMVIAEVTIGLPGMPAPVGSVVLRWDDPASRTEAARLLTNVLGPTANAPQSSFGLGFMLRRPEEIRAARVFLQCQTAPTKQEMTAFLPDHVLDDPLNLEPDGNDSYRVTVTELARAADYLAWSEQLEPQFAIVRQALQRPCARMQGNYAEPFEIPIPNFVTLRSLAQTLGARAQCHFLLGQPEEALRDLTFMHDVCRPIMEENKPMTLVSAMINVAVRGLYAGIIADGIRLQAWREPQLAALEEQLKQINLLPPAKQAFELELVEHCHNLETALAPREAYLASTISRPCKTYWWTDLKDSVIARLIPRGWVYHNLVAFVYLESKATSVTDVANQIVFPDKFSDLNKTVAHFSHWSPYTFTVGLMAPNYSRAIETTAHNQTLVNQALIACALERYRLARGEYPETLDALIPQFIGKIPHDVIGGQPPHYHRTAEGTFILYSIGWDGRDNGGVRGSARGQTVPDGDWVWPN
jgi:hypothetical protein